MSETSKLLIFVCICLLSVSTVLFSSLQNRWSQCSELQEDLERCRTLCARDFWTFYYVKPQNQNFGIKELEETLYAFNWSLRYRSDEFDCSEMSACLERYLENQGWNTSIAAGFSHAWLLVETNESYYTPVEAPTLEIIYDDSEYYDYYFDYDQLFKNIYSANAFASDEFDWWGSYGLRRDPEWIEYFTP